MANIPPHTENPTKPEQDNGKKVKIPDIKPFLLYALLAVLMIVSLKMYSNSVKYGQFFSGKPHGSVNRNNRFGLYQRIISAFSFSKRGDPKKLKSRHLILNGILISPEKKMALINNIIVKEGDAVGDVLVLQINSEFVELGNSSVRFKLTPKNK